MKRTLVSQQGASLQHKRNPHRIHPALLLNTLQNNEDGWYVPGGKQPNKDADLPKSLGLDMI